MTLPPGFDPFLADPARAVLLVDFDGSLARIVDDPGAARAVDGAAEALRSLAGSLGTVAVVSGRAVAFLRERLPIDGVGYYGLYGLESDTGAGVEAHPEAAAWKEAVEQAAAEAERRLPGILVERKGGLTVTLHWRNAPDREVEVRAVAAEVARSHGLEAPERGRMAVEIRPPIRMDKGRVVEALVADRDSVAFAGDDRGDLPAFDALDALVATGRVTHALRIAVRSVEEPPELVERGDIHVDGPDALVAMLRELGRALSA
jgi:trehalose 6-phosphate phosphatase